MKKLIGKKINSISINDDQSILSFDTGQGQVNYIARGDCCSESWFADITGVSALIGGTIAAVESVSMGDYNVRDGRGRQDIDVAYGYKLTTDKGRADIVFRNSSNGYYGGELDDYGNALPDGMTAIEDDWHA
jgi:hypothetical protein